MYLVCRHDKTFMPLVENVGSLEVRLLDTVVSISDVYVRCPLHTTCGV